jgi:hypothetical protein
MPYCEICDGVALEQEFLQVPSVLPCKSTFKHFFTLISRRSLEKCDSPDHAARITFSILQAGASSFIRHLSGHKVSRFYISKIIFCIEKQ